jgi:hypothetical protein
MSFDCHKVRLVTREGLTRQLGGQYGPRFREEMGCCAQRRWQDTSQRKL